MKAIDNRALKKAFDDADDFIKELRTFGNVEMRPDPNSKKQMWAAEDVYSDIQDFDEATRQLQQRKIEILGEDKKIAEQAGPTDATDYEGLNPTEALQAINVLVQVPELRELLMKRYDAAIELIDSITHARALGVIRPSDDLPQKLKECQEANRIYARQIVEYKQKLNLV